MRRLLLVALVVLALLATMTAMAAPQATGTGVATTMKAFPQIETSVAYPDVGAAGAVAVLAVAAADPPAKMMGTVATLKTTVATSVARTATMTTTVAPVLCT